MSVQTAQSSRRLELPSPEFIFGSTAGMREVRRKIEQALHDDLPVLIEGESGTGKEVIGRFLHDHSLRSGGPFIKINCAAIPAGLLEGEMSSGGQKRGALKAGDGADSIGHVSEGSLYLDEIGDLDLGLQKKLMQALESGNYRPGDNRGEQVSRARFVCATSIDLESASLNHRFLQELLDCFAHHRVILLPLRKRKEDIPQLCDYLIGRFAREFGRPVPHLSSYVLEAFQQWKWPGNIRELENWMARIVIFGTEEAIGLDFRRQLLAWGAEPPRRHRAVHMKVGSPRRMRRRR